MRWIHYKKWTIADNSLTSTLYIVKTENIYLKLFPSLNNYHFRTQIYFSIRSRNNRCERNVGSACITPRIYR